MRTVKQTSSREIFKPEILKKNLRFNKYLLNINKFVLTFVKVADIVHDKKSNNVTCRAKCHFVNPNAVFVTDN